MEPAGVRTRGNEDGRSPDEGDETGGRLDEEERHRLKSRRRRTRAVGIRTGEDRCRLKFGVRESIGNDAERRR